MVFHKFCSIKTLHSQIKDIIKQFYGNDNVAYDQKLVLHLYYFLKYLPKNNVWNIGLLYKTVDRASMPSICLCPCSKLMYDWQKKYISSKNSWHKCFNTVPCDSPLMSAEDLNKLVKKLKDQEVYHAALYLFLQHVYRIEFHTIK